MTENPVCGQCGKGVLLPFHSTDGRCVYFCTSCLRRFSGYAQECMKDDEPIFSQRAGYSGIEQRASGVTDPEPDETSEPVVVESREETKSVVVEETPEKDAGETSVEVVVEETTEVETPEEVAGETSVEVVVEETPEGENMEGYSGPEEEDGEQERSGEVVIEGDQDTTEDEPVKQKESEPENEPSGPGMVQVSSKSRETEVDLEEDPDLAMPEINIQTPMRERPKKGSDEPPEAIPDEPTLGDGLDIDEPAGDVGETGSEGEDITVWDDGTQEKEVEKEDELGDQDEGAIGKEGREDEKKVEKGPEGKKKDRGDMSNLDAYKKLMQKYSQG